MGRVILRSSQYINSQHIVSVELKTETETRIENEYRDNAKFHHIESYRLIIKMANGDIYEETFKDRSEAVKRREQISDKW